MAPFYRGYEKDISLDQDDIAGIQALYGDGESSTRPSVGVGVRTGIVTTTTSRPSTRRPGPSYDNTELCKGSNTYFSLVYKIFSIQQDSHSLESSSIKRVTKRVIYLT